MSRCVDVSNLNINGAGNGVDSAQAAENRPLKRSTFVATVGRSASLVVCGAAHSIMTIARKEVWKVAMAPTRLSWTKTQEADPAGG